MYTSGTEIRNAVLTMICTVASFRPPFPSMATVVCPPLPARLPPLRLHVQAWMRPSLLHHRVSFSSPPCSRLTKTNRTTTVLTHKICPAYSTSNECSSNLVLQQRIVAHWIRNSCEVATPLLPGQGKFWCANPNGLAT
jgi:hypothetical protein